MGCMARVHPLVAAAVLGIAIVSMAYPPSVAHAQGGKYKVLDHWAVGGEGGWDYMKVDAAAHRLYLSHGATVNVIDTDTGKKVADITGLQGTHGIALSPDGKYGYITDGKADAIVVFDRHTLQKIASAPAGKNPDGIAYEPVTRTVWAFNGGSNNVSVLDTRTNKVVATIDLPGRPEFPEADGKGSVFDNIEEKGELVKLDAHAMKLAATYPLTGCESPSGLAIDRKGRKLFSVCGGKVMAITSADTGRVLALAPIGEGPDAARYDAKTGMAIASDGRSGDMTFVKVKGAKPVVVQTLATAPGARTMAIDEATGRMFTVTAKFGPRPEPSETNPHGRPPIMPGSFEVLVIGK
jgi:YVTN family beta-propeller protein